MLSGSSSAAQKLDLGGKGDHLISDAYLFLVKNSGLGCANLNRLTPRPGLQLSTQLFETI